MSSTLSRSHICWRGHRQGMPSCAACNTFLCERNRRFAGCTLPCKKVAVEHLGTHTRPWLVQISLAIPPELKQHLVMDHDAIKKEGKLLSLPRQPNIEDILSSYMKAQQKRGHPDHDAEQVANGLRTYFDRSLGLVRPCSCGHGAARLSCFSAISDALPCAAELPMMCTAQRPVSRRGSA